MEVIPLVLTEDDVRAIGINYVQLIAECSTNTVLEFVKIYLSSDKANEECREIINRCYSPLLNQLEFEASEKTVKVVQLLNTLDYDSINAGTSDELLYSYKEALDFFLGCANVAPYKSPIRVARVNELLEMLKEANTKSHTRVHDKIKKYKLYFRDARSDSAKGTIFKRLCKNKEMLSLLRDGIDFLIDLKQAGVKPAQWRHL